MNVWKNIVDPVLIQFSFSKTSINSTSVHTNILAESHAQIQRDFAQSRVIDIYSMIDWDENPQQLQQGNAKFDFLSSPKRIPKVSFWKQKQEFKRREI